MAEYRLIFAPDAFSARNVEGGKKWLSYTEKLGEISDEILGLDRYDDIATMKIKASQFEQRPGEKYGIKYDESIHLGGEVITKEQQEAARGFLQRLRGFGLLADVVGTGKTFEACTVISELSARGDVETILIIVPRQIIGDWVVTLECYFGLGEGKLYQYPRIKEGEREPRIEDITVVGQDGVRRPKYPIIVALEDFLSWNPVLNDCLYDIVVVDEAHHLCDRDKEEYAGSMHRLSTLMVKKKQMKKPYCLLLSATPHSGDLEKMYRLYYFIKAKGGEPIDFENDDVNLDDAVGNHTEKYMKELKVYRHEVCRDAKTVYDFINKGKISECEAMYGADLKRFYIREFPALSDSFDFSELSEGEKIDVINEFLEEDEAKRSRVLSRIADMYHNEVMRSIMIRNSKKKTSDSRIGNKRKTAVNVFFLPSDTRSGYIEIDGTRLGTAEKIKVDVSKIGSLDAKNAGYLFSEGEWITPEEYVKRNPRANRGAVYFGILEALGLSDKTLAGNDGFVREGVLNYYYTQLLSLDSDTRRDDIKTLLVPISRATDVFSAKLEYLKAIIRKHSSERILVFFDYDVRGEKRGDRAVSEALLAEADIKDRLLFADATNKTTVKEKFDEKENAVLIARDVSVTEGGNLQSSNIVINFSVTPDPVAMEQRVGRVFRLGQKNDVTVYSLADMRSLEGYVLMYYSRIGLLCSNSGDATIIAGSSNDNMVAVQCPECCSVKLLSRAEFESRDAKAAGEIGALFCDAKEQCRANSPSGSKMFEISVNDFKCASCGATFNREEEGYVCLSRFGEVMSNDGKAGNREIYCRKICSIAHCKRFAEGGEYSHCPALKAYKEGVREDSELKARCLTCKKKCPEKCRVAMTRENTAAAVAGCFDCPNSLCSPSPRSLRFNGSWEAACPICNSGRLRPVAARTFSTYVKKLWDFKFDKTAFAENLGKDANRVADVPKILGADSERDEGDRR